MHHAKESMKKNPRKFSEGSLLLKMTRHLSWRVAIIKPRIYLGHLIQFLQ
jgi:hypothetical protein